MSINKDLVRRASASIDVLKGYLKTVSPDTLSEDDREVLQRLIDVAANAPVAAALQPKKQALTEG